MKLISKLFGPFSPKKKESRGETPGSKFEKFDFSTERFECTISSFSGTSICQDLFLNRYDLNEIREMMNRIGIIGLLGEAGFSNPVLTIDRDAANVHYLKVFHGKTLPARLLIEIRLSQIIYTPEERHVAGIIKERRYKVIAIEWLCLQNPRGQFTREQPRLPGQDHPGLGAIRFIAPMMEMFAGDLGVDAILDVPEHFHAAVMYSRKFIFMDPAREGIMRAVLRDLGSSSLADLSWGFITGTILDAQTGEPVPYEPSEQLLPVAESLARYFTSREYRKRVEDEADRRKFIFDYAGMVRKRNVHPDYKNHR